MATKKCPKCGEENPAEAVMCWACYTPLAGGAAAAAGGGLVTPRGGVAAVTPAATAAAEEAGKTSIDPKIFVVVGLLIGAMIIGAFTTGLIGGGSDAPTAPEIAQLPGGETGDGFVVQPPAPPPQAVPPPVFNPGGGGGGGTTGAVAPQFKTVVPPDPRQPIGTMGIILSTPNASPSQALSMAKFAKRTFESGGKWSGMQVAVFNNPDSAKTFLKYQAQRKGAPLSPANYQELAEMGVWGGVPVYYETRGKTELPYQPSANPKGWWSGGR